MFDISACNVERTKDHNYLVTWRALPSEQQLSGDKVAIYMSETPDHFYAGTHLGIPVAYATNHIVLIPNPDIGVRHYFYLQSDKGEAVILAERQLSLQGAPNFRDLGGYETQCGRRLKWGKLYRSGKLSELTEWDIGYINRLGVSLVCDFRKEIERELEPTWLGEEHSHTYAGLAVTPGSSESFITNLHNGIIAVDDAAGFMKEINRDFVINQMPQYAEMFRLLLSGEQQLLIHCASGKDRTGFGAALLLDVLGVEEDIIIDDYLLTNTYLPADQEIKRLSNTFTDSTGKPVSDDVLRPLLELRPEYLGACFDEMKKRYESKQHFFESALNLDDSSIKVLKDRYLE